MSTRTQNLGLFKYDTVNDSELPFSIDDALNDNWDALDSVIANLDPLPDQTGKSGYILTTNGTNPSWNATQEVYPVITQSKTNTNGYLKFSNGTIVQWGRVTDRSATSTPISFPLSFTSTYYSAVVMMGAAESITSAAALNPATITTRTSSGFTILVSNTAYANYPFLYWMVWGF